MPFCTSHSSGLGSSASNLHALASGAHWLEGRRFGADASSAEVEDWLSASGIAAAEASSVPASFDLETRQVTLNDGLVMPTNGLGTYSLKGQICVKSVAAALAAGVRLVDTAYMYGNEAEVGRAIRESGVPRDEVFVNSGCKFQDQGGIFIGDRCLIGHNVIIATLNHHMDVERRGGMAPKPMRRREAAFPRRASTALIRRAP